MCLSSSVQLRPNRTTWTRLHLSSSVSPPLRGETELDNLAIGFVCSGRAPQFAQNGEPHRPAQRKVSTRQGIGGSLLTAHTCGLDDRGNSLHSLPAGRFVSLWVGMRTPFLYGPPAIVESAENLRSSSPLRVGAGRDPPSTCTRSKARATSAAVHFHLLPQSTKGTHDSSRPSHSSPFA